MVVRIAVIAPPWLAVPPVAYGGTEAALDVLCRGLVSRGHDVLLVTTGDAQRLPGVEHSSLFATPAAGLGSSAEPGSEPELVRTAEVEHAVFGHRAATEWGADLIHDHTVSGPAFGAARRAASIGPAVVTTHHGPFDDRVGAVFIALSQLLPVIAISQSHARRSYGARIAAVIHHGVDLERFSPADASLTESALFVGRLCPDKGLEMAIHAARRAGVGLRIAAKMREAAEHTYFRSRIEPLLGSGIEYLGEVSRGDLVHLMSTSTCLLNPIEWDEPFGLVAIEALACGLPVVTTPRGAMVELVDDGRTGFVRSTVDELADALRHIATIDRSVCRADAVRRFSMDRVAADHERLYYDCIELPGTLTTAGSES
jgi:glycosyltransferase involved in cell wall biosynthesis